MLTVLRSRIAFRQLKRDLPGLFEQLTKSTIQKWLSQHGHRWSTRTLENVRRRHALAGTGRVGVLKPYPIIVEKFKKQLLDLRAAGIVVSRLLGRTLLLAIIEKEKPDLLEHFACSEHFIGDFFESVMNWSVRKGTRTAAHLPENASDLCEETLFRIVHLMVTYEIPPYLLINMDQQGILVLIGNNTTYDTTGSRQVCVAAKDEKRAYTLCVSSTPAGDILPFQQIGGGMTSKSLPFKGSLTQLPMSEAAKRGFHFAFAASEKTNSHFSTLKTMKEASYVVLPSR
jgi:hypothetical protein